MNQALGFRAYLVDPNLVGLYDLWAGLSRRLGRLPYRQEIDPLDLPPSALPVMMVLEQETSGRVRCRLAGTLLTHVYGFDPSGWYLDEVMPSEPAAFRRRMYERVLGERRAAVCRIQFAVPGREFIASDRLYVPALGESSDRPTVLFTAQSFLTSAEVTGEPDAYGVYELRYDESTVDRRSDDPTR